MRNTFLLTLVVVPIQVAIALAMGSMVAKVGAGVKRSSGSGRYRSEFSDLAAGLVWLAILQNTGYLNTASPVPRSDRARDPWLTYETPVALFVAIAAAEIWRGTAIVMIIIVAGLNQIPKEFAEAAEIFGAGRWTRFRASRCP